MSGTTAQKVKGVVQEKLGKVLGDERMQIEGESKKFEAQRAAAIKKHGQSTGTGKIHGQTDQTLGAAKQNIGAATGNPNLQAKGAAQRMEGAANNTGQYYHGQQTAAGNPAGGYPSDYQTQQGAYNQTGTHGLTGTHTQGHGQYATGTHPQNQGCGHVGSHTHEHGQLNAPFNPTGTHDHGLAAGGVHGHPQGCGHVGTHEHGQCNVGNHTHNMTGTQAQGQPLANRPAQEHGQYVANTHPQGNTLANTCCIHGNGQQAKTPYPQGQAGPQQGLHAHGQPTNVPFPQERADGMTIPANQLGPGGNPTGIQRTGNDVPREYL